MLLTGRGEAATLLLRTNHDKTSWWNLARLHTARGKEEVSEVVVGLVGGWGGVLGVGRVQKKRITKKKAGFAPINLRRFTHNFRTDNHQHLSSSK